MQIDYPNQSASTTGETDCPVDGSGFVSIEGERYYRISDVDRMAPFLMNIVSATNHWMFAASNGALTAGRRNADNALFPYCTQDKLFESFRTVGSCTLIWVKSGDGEVLWEPFRNELRGTGRSRNLYKSVDGSRVVFEEIDSEMRLGFRYSWMMGERFGFLRNAALFRLADTSVEVRILDGIQNVVPYGLDQNFLSHFSNLADAYKKNELLQDEGIGIYYLSSIPTDRAEPSEGLKATVVWSAGLDREAVLLSSKQVEAFILGETLETEDETRGERCSYLVESAFTLVPGERREWWLAADINQDASQIEALRERVGDAGAVLSELEEDYCRNLAGLRGKVAASDGMQLTANGIRDARHRSNTMFNIMRGGVFNNGYTLSVSDFRSYLGEWNRDVLQRHASALDSWGAEVERQELLDWVEMQGDEDLFRLATEYLPLSFSRRHGDPSRPWNKFSIDTEDEQGNPVLTYQGNWRDIFQNWEPLGYSYPGYLTGMIFRFLNASTADGYNPYRVTRDGFDWEILDPEEPWSNIGYWGDHQIIYLLKLLEALDRHFPQTLRSLLDKSRFVFAHVPYRIRGFAEIWADPRQTVFYDDGAAGTLLERSKAMGSDGKLLRRKDGEVVRASLLEKLLTPLLAKMSNFVVDGGIWMNTQRPEWNDANNALVGYGVSVVTLCYVNRYVDFMRTMLVDLPDEQELRLESKLADFLREQVGIMRRFETVLEDEIDGALRFEILEAFGVSGESYRKSVYDLEVGESRESLTWGEVKEYLEFASRFAGHTIDSNRRPDALYHSYNLLRTTERNEVEVGRLSEMLEGQVAVLSSKRLAPDAAVRLLAALRTSRLYREGVGSYMLYPDKDLPRFLEKNIVSKERVEGSLLLRDMLARGDRRIISKDSRGNYRFNGAFKNAGDLGIAIGELRDEYAELANAKVVDNLLSLFEDTFDHRSFTGRSGTFFAYEGLGSIYWHMVSKLVLAIQENCFRAKGTSHFAELAKYYFETLEGLGFGRKPEDYGAFPIDAYSHTPKQAGAQQPGMTGQVKEDILSRWGELGIFVSEGRVRFDPVLLRESEFIQEVDTSCVTDVPGGADAFELCPGSLAFTYCQTLIVYRIGDAPGVSVEFASGKSASREALELTKDESAALFRRDGSLSRIEVAIPREQLCRSLL